MCIKLAILILGTSRLRELFLPITKDKQVTYMSRMSVNLLQQVLSTRRWSTGLQKVATQTRPMKFFMLFSSSFTGPSLASSASARRVRTSFCSEKTVFTFSKFLVTFKRDSWKSDNNFSAASHFPISATSFSLSSVTSWPAWVDMAYKNIWTRISHILTSPRLLQAK